MADNAASQNGSGTGGGTRQRLLASLLINLVGPPVVYYVLSGSGVADFTALAAATAVPAIWTLASLAVRRRIDWIGVLATCGYALSLIASTLLDSTLLLKAHEVLLTGPLGVVLLVSALVGRPLLVVLLRALRPEEMARRAPQQAANGKPQGTLATALVGLVLVVHAGINLALAATLPSQDFLVAQKSVTIVLLLVTIGGLMLVRRWLLAKR